jgi:predicted phosphate transport protein (TIGR00153 family)
MRVLPKTQEFFNELEKHAAHIVTASRLLLEISTSSGDLAACAKRIKELESECDEITHSVVLKLHKTFITPLDRLDTHDIVARLDDVMDALEQAAYSLTRYQPQQQKGRMPPQALRLLEVVARSIEVTARGVGLLRHLKKGDELLGVCREVKQLEQQADGISREAVALLFEDVRDAALLLKWKEVYEALETVTDRCDDVADVLENIVLDNA